MLADEKLARAEAEIKRLTESLARLKDQLVPVFKVVKEFQPLPTPESSKPTANLTSQPSLSRKFSTKKLFLNSTPRQPSPTQTPNNYINSTDFPVSPHSPSKYADSITPSTRVNTPVHSYTSLPAVQESNSYSGSSNLPTRLPAPPRPPPPGVTPLNVKVRGSDRDYSPALSTSHSTGSDAVDQFKSFRVNLDDPCSKVLPAALKKYKIQSDWREYSLFICYADQERCMGLDEKPLLVFQELQKANKSPVFMLRKHETTNTMPVLKGTGMKL